MNDMHDRHLVAFGLDTQRFALFLSSVNRAERIAAVLPLPDAPDMVLGIINVHGCIVPVFDIRKRFKLPPRKLTLTDHILIASTVTMTVAIVVDEVFGVMDQKETGIVDRKEILKKKMNYIEGVVKLKDGMVLIHDINKFFSLEEEAVLKESIEKYSGRDD